MPVKDIDCPFIVSGGSGTNFPSILFKSLIESFVLSVLLIEQETIETEVVGEVQARKVAQVLNPVRVAIRKVEMLLNIWLSTICVFQGENVS